MRKNNLFLAANLLFISTSALASTPNHQHHCLSHNAIAEAQACLFKSGLPFSRAYINEQGLMSLVEKPSSIEGDFSSYVKNMEDLNSPLLVKALESEGKKLQVKVGAIDKKTGKFAVKLVATDAGDANNTGAVILSNMGPDISGRDILSWFNRSKLGDGYTLTTSLSHGFSDLRTMSKGGKYETAYLAIEKVTPFGELKADYTYAKNLSGGEARLYELGGLTNRASLSAKHWLGRYITFKHGFEFTDRSQDFGTFNISENQDYLSYTPSLSHTGQYYSVTLSAKKGLSGSRDYDLVPLMGTFNLHYWSSTLDISSSGPFALQGLSYSAKVKGFTGDKEMPSSERLGLGGQDAGSSHESGLYSGYQGYQYMAGLNHVHMNDILGAPVELFANLNGSHITTATNDVLELTSAEIGSSIHFQDWAIQASYSSSIKTQNLDDDQRISAKIIWRY